jgi:hypothetical protein
MQSFGQPQTAEFLRKPNRRNVGHLVIVSTKRTVRRQRLRFRLKSRRNMPPRRHTSTSRYELKYMVDERCARGATDFIRAYLQRDRYAIRQMAYSYPIYSLYLDGPGLMLYSATCQGLKNRYKLRIRYYDYNPLTSAYFEIKRRVGDVIIKDRVAVRKSSVERLIAGACAMPEDLVESEDRGDYLVLRQFCELRDAIQARPRIIVQYRREAWVSEEDARLRVSFDRMLTTASYQGCLHPAHWVDAGLPAVVLELKFNDRFPLWMRELALDWDLHRTPMAKYVHCTDRLPRSGESCAGASVGSFYERSASESGQPGFADGAGQPATGVAGAADRLLHGPRRFVGVHADPQRPVVFTDVHVVAARAAGGRSDDDDAAGGKPAGGDRPAVGLRDDSVS